MLSTETIFIATPLKRLFNGNIASSDISNAKKVPEKIEKAARGIFKDQKPSKASTGYKYKDIVRILEADQTDEDLFKDSSKLMKNTGDDFADLIPKVMEVKQLMKSLLPYNQVNDVLGLHLRDPSIRDQLAYLRLWAVVDDPITLIDKINDNSFTKPEINIMQQVYPEIYQGVIDFINSEIMSINQNGKEVVGKNRALGIRRFLGESIQRKLPATSQEQPQPQGRGGGTGAARNVKLANRMAPESQSAVE